MSHSTEAVLNRIGGAYTSATELARRSIMFQNLGLRSKGNIISDAEMGGINWMMNETRRGFQLVQKASDLPEKQLRELDKHPAVDLIEQARGMMGILQDADLSVPEASCLAYFQFRLTLKNLQRSRTFSFADVLEMDTSLNLGEQEFEVTHWNYPDHPDFMWSLINGLHQTLIQTSDDAAESVLRAGHFFAAGKQLGLPVKK